jgi:hypothetical protein
MDENELVKANHVQPKSALPIVRISEFLKSLPATVPKKPCSEDIGLSIASSISPQTTIQVHLHAALSSVPVARSSSMVKHADVILATLLLVALDQPPLAVKLAIPATLYGEPGSEQQLAADFRFDVAPLLAKHHKAGIYQVYLLADLQTFGPLAVRID